MAGSKGDHDYPLGWTLRAQPEKSCAISAGSDSIRLRDWMGPPMAWTEAARRDHARRCHRYSSDLTDREWALLTPLFPSPRRLGRPRTTDLREVVNAIQYIAATGCQRRLLPRDFPPFTTVQHYFYDWRNCGLLRAINHLMVMAA
ncbi:MAG: putative transposase [Paracoccaceae bacterium]|jgi:putative transposase